MISELERQRDYVKKIYENGAPCPVCGKTQTPWEAAGLESAEAWIGAHEREYVCVECGTALRHDVYLMGGWGWGNPTVRAHR